MKKIRQRSEEYYESLLKRLANYHNAQLVNLNGLCFRFGCGNEAMTWDKIDWNGHADVDAELVEDPKTFLDNYLGKHMFLRTCGRGDWTDDFNLFGPRMISAKSYSELELKLDVFGK